MKVVEVPKKKQRKRILTCQKLSDDEEEKEGEDCAPDSQFGELELSASLKKQYCRKYLQASKPGTFRTKPDKFCSYDKIDNKNYNKKKNDKRKELRNEVNEI